MEIYYLQAYEKVLHEITDPSKPEALKTSLFLSPERKILDGKKKEDGEILRLVSKMDGAKLFADIVDSA